MLIVFGGIFWYSTRHNNSTQDYKTDKESMKNNAYVMSMDFVKNYLKNPASADFDVFTANPSVTVMYDNYTVTYHFTAKNSFNADIQSYYTCSMKYTGGDPSNETSWQLLGLMIDGQMIAGNFPKDEMPVTANDDAPKNFAKYYETVSRDGNGLNLSLYVYLSDTSKLKAVNDELLASYKGKWTMNISIWYFDKKSIVDKWIAATQDHSGKISDAEFNALDKHMICQYEQNEKGESNFDYNR